MAEAALVCPVSVGRVCRTFAKEGLEAALFDKPRPGREPKITGDIEAQLVTLACSDPPEGRGRWTLRLLERVKKVRIRRFPPRSTRFRAGEGIPLPSWNFG